MNKTSKNLLRWLALVPIGAAFAVSTASAQAVAEEKADELKAKEQQAATTKPVVVEKAPAPVAAEGETIVLSPFVVTSDDDKGYMAANTMSGTRINTKIEDLGASISVITKQQLLDTASVDINDIFTNEVNTEGTNQYTEFMIDGKGNSIDTAGVDPSKANRVRGLGAANIAINGYGSMSGVPVDAYNVDSVEISRGPNSSIFGLGESSGTVNLIGSSANLTRQINNVQLRADSYDGYRTSFDFNRPIVKDKLALRFQGVYEEKGYVRQPSQDTTKRWQISLTAKPFKMTTIRASYEDYNNTASRPNSVTPRDYITPWIDAGMPTYRPMERAVYKNGARWNYAVSQGGAWTAATFNNRWLASTNGIMNPGSGIGEFSSSYVYSRPSLWLDQGKVVYFSTGRRAGDLGTLTTVPGPGVYSGTNLDYFEVSSGVNFSTAQAALWKPVGISNKALYDWEKINFAAANYATKKAGTLKLELEQFFISSARQQLAVQLGFFSENSYEYRRNFIGQADGAPANVLLDLNETRLDGSPNPYFLNTLIAGGEPQAYVYPVDNKNYRGTVAYQLDLTREKSFWRFLGRNNFVYYSEQKDSEWSPSGLRYRDYITSEHAWQQRYDPAKGTWSTAQTGNGSHAFYRFYIGDANGYNVDRAPSRPSDGYEGQRNFYYYNGKSQQWVTETVNYEELYFAIGMEYKSVKTRGFVWQGSFLKNQIKWLPDLEIIPTAGRRTDSIGTKRGGTGSLIDSTKWLDSKGYPLMDNVYTYEPNWWAVRSGKTTTRGIVVRPLKWISFHYNKSDSFKPEGMAYTIFRDELTNPTGKGKDYGVTLNLWNGKLVIRANKYEVFDKDARNTATAVTGTRPPRIDFDTRTTAWDEDQAAGTYDAFNLEKSLFRWALAADHVTTTSVNDLPAADQRALVEQYMTTKVWTSPYLSNLGGLGLAHAQFFRQPGIAVADVNNVESKGYELELNYNPNRYFSIKSTFAKQQAIDKDLSANMGRYIAERLPVWQSVVIPAGLQTFNTTTQAWEADANAGLKWWDTKVGNYDRPSDWFAGNVDAPFALASANAGKPRGQTRQYRWNLTTRYSLDGISDNKILRNMAIGGGARWEDKAVIGYLAAAPSADQVYRRYDASKPVYDKARYYFDFWASYNMKLWSDKVSCRLQLNVRNIFENGRLQTIGINPDGTSRDFRIIDPRQFILSATFDL